MPSIAEVYVRLHVDPSAVKRDTEEGLRRVDTRAEGERAGTQYGTAYGRGLNKNAEKHGSTFAQKVAAGITIKRALIGGAIFAGLATAPALFAAAGVGAAAALGGALILGLVKLNPRVQAATKRLGTEFTRTFNDAANRSGFAVKLTAAIDTLRTRALPPLRQAFTVAFGAIGPLLKPATEALIGFAQWLAAHANPAVSAFSGWIKTLKGPVQSLIGQFKDTVWPNIVLFLRQMAGSAGNSIGAFGKLLGSLSTLLPVIGGVASVAALLVNRFPVLIPIIIALTAAIKVFGIVSKIAFISTPWGLAIAAIVAGAVLIIKYWKPISGFFVAVWNHVYSGFIRPVINFFTQTIPHAFSVAIGAIRRTLGTWAPILATLLLGPIGGAVVFIVTHWNTVKRITLAVFGAIGSFFARFWGNVQRLFFGAVHAVGNVVAAGWNAIRNFVGSVFGAIGGFFARWWGATTRFFFAAVHTVGRVLADAWNAVRTFILSIWNGIGRFFADWWGKTTRFFFTAVHAVGRLLGDAWNAIKTFVLRVWNDIGAFFAKWWGNTVKFFFNSVHAVAKTLGDVWNAISGTVSRIWGNIGKFFATWWGNTKKFVSDRVHDVAKIISDVWDNIYNRVKGAWAGIVKGIGAAWDGIKKIVATPLNVVIGFIDTFLIGGVDLILSTIGIKGKGPHGGPIPNIPKIPGYTGGGRLPGFGGGDRVPAWIRGAGPALLEPGEAVVDKYTTAAHSRELSEWGVPGFAKGGRPGLKSYDDGGTPTRRGVPGDAGVGTPLTVEAMMAMLPGFATGAQISQSMLNFMVSKKGQKYSQAQRWGEPPWDCSSLLWQAAHNAGVPIPKGQALANLEADWFAHSGWASAAKNAVIQGAGATRNPKTRGTGGQVQAGDLLFMTGAGPGPSSFGGVGHTGMALNSSTMISALGSMFGVTSSSIHNLKAAIRIGGSGANAVQVPGLAWGGIGSFLLSSLSDILGLVPGPLKDALNTITGLGGGFSKVGNAPGWLGQLVHGVPGFMIGKVIDWVKSKAWSLIASALGLGGGGGGGSGPAGVGASAGTMANGKQIYEYLLKNLFGGNKIAAAGATASIWGESTWNPFSVGSGGRGLIGWTPASTISNADFKGGMATQLPAILRFVVNSHDEGVIAQMFHASSVEQAANLWGRGVERFGINDVHSQGITLAKRIAGLKNGGMIPEPMIGIGASGRMIALGENGRERVVPSDADPMLAAILELVRLARANPAQTAAGVARAVTAPAAGAAQAARAGAR